MTHRVRARGRRVGEAWPPAESIAAKYRPGPWARVVSRLQRETSQSRVKGAWRIGRALRRLYPDRDLVWPTRHGFSLIINPAADPYQRQIFEAGTYEPATLALIARLLRGGDVFVDVGANIGLMTLVGARSVGPAARFTPSSHIRGSTSACSRTSP